MRSSALLLSKDLTLELGWRELAEPAVGQAVVRVELAGLCGSDLHVLRTGDWVSYWPATIGHEVVGVVESCPGGEFEPGARVVVDSRVPCGSCPGCARSANRCYDLAWVGEALPGGFQSHLLIAAGSLVGCPGSLPAEVAVLAEPLAVAIHAVSLVASQPRRVLIVGHGPIGALVHLEIARRWPDARITVAEPDPARSAMALRLGAALLGEQDGPARYDLVVDAAGYPGSLIDDLHTVDNGATVLLVALGHQSVEIVPAALVEHEIHLIGSNGFDSELPRAVSLLAEQPARYRFLVTEIVALLDAPTRLGQLLETPAVGKVVVRP